jgi:hypothetical protein
MSHQDKEGTPQYFPFPPSLPPSLPYLRPPGGRQGHAIREHVKRISLQGNRTRQDRKKGRRKEEGV